MVSVPPAKSLRPQEEEEPVLSERASSQKTDSVEPGAPVLKEVVTSKPVSPEPSKPVSVTDIVSVNVVPEHSAPCAALTSHKDSVAVDSEGGSVSTSAVSDVSELDKPLSPPAAQAIDSPDGAGSPGPLVCEGSTKSPTGPAKDVPLDSKDPKPEDRQSNTPSPPVSTFSSGTSTTSDIEVLDHESVLSESSAGSRQGPEAKASLNLMQSSFQLLSPSACPDFQRLEEFQKLTESCGSSDAFERIDSFSVQSLDSRSVSEINSDDELPGRACTLASVTTSPSTPIALVPGAGSEDQEEERGEAGPTDAAREHALDENEMEESGRSATPVNCEQPEEDAGGGCRTAGDLGRMMEPAGVGEPGESSCYRITELQKVTRLPDSLHSQKRNHLSYTSTDITAPIVHGEFVG